MSYEDDTDEAAFMSSEERKRQQIKRESRLLAGLFIFLGITGAVWWLG